MEDEITGFLKDLLLPVIIAIFGGLVRIFNDKRGLKHYTIGLLCSGILTAAFTGILVYWLTADLDLSDNVRSATVAISGYTSRDLIGIIADKFLKRMKNERN